MMAFLVRTLADKQQLFENVECWKPRLIVAYLPNWTPEESELALELVRRQHAGGPSSIHSTAHDKAGLHLVYGTLGGRNAARFWWAATTTHSAGRLTECVAEDVAWNPIGAASNVKTRRNVSGVLPVEKVPIRIMHKKNTAVKPQPTEQDAHHCRGHS